MDQTQIDADQAAVDADKAALIAAEQQLAADQAALAAEAGASGNVVADATVTDVAPAPATAEVPNADASTSSGAAAMPADAALVPEVILDAIAGAVTGADAAEAVTVVADLHSVFDRVEALAVHWGGDVAAEVHKLIAEGRALL